MSVEFQCWRNEEVNALINAILAQYSALLQLPRRYGIINHARAQLFKNIRIHGMTPF